MQYVIQSENERGFWSAKEQGWVRWITDASCFMACEVERIGPIPNVPSIGNDAKWQVYCYD